MGWSQMGMLLGLGYILGGRSPGSLGKLSPAQQYNCHPAALIKRQKKCSNHNAYSTIFLITN